MAKYRDLFIGRWVGLMLAFVFLVALLAPSGAVARVEYTNDTSGMEGDPGDGNGFTGGGGGSDWLDDGESATDPISVRQDIYLLVPILVPGAVQVFVIPVEASYWIRILGGGAE